MFEFYREVNRLEEQQKDQMVDDQAEEKVEQTEETVSKADEVGEDTIEVIDADENEVNSEQTKLAELEQQVAELNQRYLRVNADYENFRRRTREEKEAAAKYRAQSIVEELLPVLDNFERALSVSVENDEAKSLLQGMEMVYRQLQDALIKEGVAVIEAKGQKFDPHLHQAVMQEESSEHEPNEVIEELQKGYKLKDRIIRPAMVKVNA